MSAQHTPGPWKLHLANGGKRVCFVQGSPDPGEKYGEGVTNYGGISKPCSARGIANAHLIAAAPELLEALKALLEDTQHSQHSCGDPACPVDFARQVVAKAEGR